MAFRLCEFDAIGFDVDHAFVQYKLENLFQLVYESLAQVLVETRNYPKALLEEPFKNFSDFCTRGLVLDSAKGDFVKLSKDGKVLRASHGTKIMDETAMNKEYGEDRKWSPFEEFIEDMKSKSRFLHRGNYRMFDTFFDMPAMVLCARLVDIVDKEESGNKQKYQLIWRDVLSSLIVNFDSASFAGNKGHFYPTLKADVCKYVKPTSEKLKDWLKMLRKERKKLFLITNSQADFSMFVLENAFGNDWRSYFDAYISRAQKPGFFRNKNHFLEVVNRVTGKDAVESLECDKNYAQGNSMELQKYLAEITDKTDANFKVLFCGDSIISDVYPPRFFSNWKTVALLEELEIEIKNKDCIEYEPDTKKKKSNKMNGDEKNAHTASSKDVLTSKTWGSIFGADGKLMNTLFGSLVDEYSSLVVAGLDSITELPLDHLFEENFDGHTRFYPQAPLTT